MTISLFSSILGAAGILMSILAIVISGRLNRRMSFFHKHILASRHHLVKSIDSIRQGDLDQAELQLAACQEELDRAQYYL